MVVAGYERTGQYPVDFATKLRQCTYSFKLQQYAVMTANFDEAVSIFRLRGEITEAKIDALEIPSVQELQRNKTPKDQR